jgi:Arm DNA-binding domain
VKRFYTYIIKSSDGIVRYVGKGCNKRCLCHFNRREFSSIQDLSIDVKYHEDEKTALVEEARLIEKYDSEHLINIAGRTAEAVKKRMVLKPPILLTDEVAKSIPFSTDRQEVIRDEVCRGLHIIVGKRTKSYSVQTDLRSEQGRKTIKISLGNVQKVSIENARKEAEVIIQTIRSGKDPRHELKSLEIAA